jgi:IS30 family transposase
MKGRWEGDLIKGTFNCLSGVSPVERRTRLVAAGNMNGSTAPTVFDSFVRHMSRCQRKPLCWKASAGAVANEIQAFGLSVVLET